MSFSSPNHYQQFYSHFNAIVFEVIEGLEKLLQKPPSSIADIGCGTGISSIALSTAFPNSKVVGYDISNEMLEYARRNSPVKIEYQNLGSQASSLPMRFDMAFFKSSYHIWSKATKLPQKFLLTSLSRNGKVCLVELTDRSIRSFPLVPEAHSFWIENCKSKSLFPSFSLTRTLCVGNRIKLPFKDFQLALKENQISTLSNYHDDPIDRSVELNANEEIEILKEFKISIFEISKT